MTSRAMTVWGGADPRRGTGERGVVSIELLGYFFTVMVMLLAALQLFVVAHVAVSASNAARTAARVSSQGGGGEAAAMAALASGLQGGATVAAGGGAAVVAVEIPVLLFHGTSVGTITRTAQMPAAAGPGGDLGVLAAGGGDQR